MIINKITRFFLTVITVVITPFKWLTTVPAYILINTPLIKVVYQLIVMAVWFPFGVFITAMSVIYKSVPIVGFLLALIGIPIVLLGYTISYLLSPRSQEERAFIEASQSYPSVGDII
jgi:NADH:ubiquinone oxidoreductase subunit 3 (subunit A)